MKKLLMSITIAATMFSCSKLKEDPSPVALSCYERTTKDYLAAYERFAQDPGNVSKCREMVNAARKVVDCPGISAEERRNFEEAAKNACQ
ncbi:hypothetical protein [Emticicia sp. C21]|uniref:hypothetical protein n=1 Tax=Emticicia sp. C21 TaxID=2302915 RepID=UPI000E85C3BE|nr:hypothetical protein [Emticicia sp. C21]RFS15337.1 hypothetical protein D0T08_17600 [Emticicia sp. C21]